MKELFMTLLNPESLSWINQLETIRALGPNASRADRKKALNLSDGLVTAAINLEVCFDPAAIEKVRQASKVNPPYILSSKSAKALVGLKKAKVPDLTGSVHAALDITLSQRLTTRQIEALVEWIISGKSASEFDPNNKTAVKPRRKRTKKDKIDKEKGKGETETLDLDQLGQLLEKAKAEKALGKETTALKKLEKYLQSLFSSSSSSKDSQNASGSKRGFSETIMLDWLADIPVIAQIKSKIKKGKDITKGEVAFLWLHKGGEILGRLVKIVLKLLKPLLKPLFKIIHWVGKLVIDVLKEVGLYKYAKALVVFAGLFIACWFAWETFNYGLMRPVEMIWSKIHFHHAAEESPAEEAPAPVAPQAVGSSELEVRSSNLKPKTNNSKLLTPNSPPAAVYQPSIAWQSSYEDQTVLDTEIAAVPVSSFVKDFPLEPDEGMRGDMAVSRLQDLIDPDKYTMKIGRDTKKILSVNATTTNLIINYQSTDPLGGLSGSIPMNCFWEDIIMIHVDEIDIEGKSPKVIYQCSLIVSGAKEPLTIQCSTSADLKHLVSTVEYFIRASRLAHDTALAGMPYPSQGIRLNNQCLVEVLWANSPANKVGVKLGDLIWSLEKDAYYPQNQKDLETQLTALTLGSHALYIVRPVDREKGLVDMNANHTTVFNPKRQKVMLTVF